MKIYTYSQARARLSDVLDEAKCEEVLIRRRKGDLFSIVPKIQSGHSPFDVPGLKKTVSRAAILAAVRESRKRA